MNRLHSRGRKIGKEWANRVGRAKDNDKAKAVGNDVRTACEGLRAAGNVVGRKLDAKA